MIILNFALLILVAFSAKAQAEKCNVGAAEKCDVGVDGCSWTCTKVPPKPGQVTCQAVPGTPKSCEVGSTLSLCGTTCTCSKAKTCKVGEKGCTWTCQRAPLKPGQVTCFAIPGTPETCVVGSSITSCGTTCTCSQEKKCTVGVKGCNWTCVTAPPQPGVLQCLAYPAQPTECYPGETSSICGTTCTCSQEKKCTVGVKGCNWTCVTTPPPPGVLQCLAYPATPTECYPGETSSLCGTTCTCSA